MLPPPSPTPGGITGVQHHTRLEDRQASLVLGQVSSHPCLRGEARPGDDMSWILMLLFRELEHWVMGTEKRQPVRREPQGHGDLVQGPDYQKPRKGTLHA